ncbi:MAG TPA: Na+/H+ antiporter [Nitrococcus sp.]|nr:Na+/H+ antiporter [Nitrococcus sp.]
MEVVAVVLVMLLAIVISGAITRMLPIGIPMPLVQIALGAAIAAVANLGVRLDPEIFFLLFIPPLLFLDGWHIPKEGFFRDSAIILELAFGLVFFTVVGLGFFLHWMIPTLPLAVAFALAAVLSPTDPVAVSAITSRVPIPIRVMHILEGESLLNDASGLVCMRFALAAVLTGTFSLPAAVANFLWLALGGIVFGAGSTWLITQGRIWMSKRFGEDTGAQILISLLIPFGAYLIAENLHCSGILAAVAAGITMSYAEITGATRGEIRMQRTAVWNTVQFAANGAIFVLLGEQIPAIVADASEAINEAGHGEVWLLAVYVIVITAALVCLRFLWVWTSLRLTLYRAARRGEQRPTPSWRLVVAVSLAGVRGAITLAGVLTFPLALPNGSPFPARELAIFLAAGVIMLSLIAASIGLPKLLTNLQLPPEPNHQEEEDRLRAAAAQAAIQAVESALRRMAEGRSDADLYAEAAVEVMRMYRSRLDEQKSIEVANQHRIVNEIERQLRLAGLQAERDEVFKRARRRRIDDEIARKVIRELDLLEARLTR